MEGVHFYPLKIIPNARYFGFASALLFTAQYF